MIRDRFHAMGTTVEVLAEHPEGVTATRGLFEDLEQRFSRFRPTSELSALNDDPARQVRLSTPMREILGFAATMRERTGGLVDPAIGSQVAAWGYDRTFDEVTGPVHVPLTDPAAAWTVEDDVLVRSPGTRFDLGGIAKGWAADLAIDSGIATLVSAGGDVRSASGTAVVEVEDPHDGSVTRVELGHGGLATSSVSRRRWTVGGYEVHHIIDPRTGAPAVSPVVAATALCPTAAEAEAAAKAVLVLGGGGLAWASDQDWITAALVSWSDGSTYATRGWEYAA